MFKKTIALLLLLPALNACNSNPSSSTQTVYFSLKNYIESEVKTINAATSNCFKTVKVNQSLESKLIEKSELIKDLNGFLTYDINKLAWKNSFKIDSDIQNHIVYYNSTEDFIPVKKLAIYYKENDIKKIRLIIRADNKLFKSQKVIDLIPSKGYVFYNSQQVTGMDEQVLWIKAAY